MVREKQQKKTFMVRKTNICNVDINNIVAWNFIETNNNFKFLIEYLDEVIKPLVLILPKLSRYTKKKNKDKGGNRKNKLLSLCVDVENLLEKSKRLKIW